MHTDSFVQKVSEKSRGEEGFSVLEVVVAMVIFLVVTGSIWGLMQTGLRSRNATSENVSLTKTVRLSLNLIGRDTYNAGLGYPVGNTVVVPDNRISNLLGIPPDVDTTRDTVPPIITGNNITLNTFNMTPNVRTDQVTFLFRDTAFNPVDDPVLPGIVPVSRPLNMIARAAGDPFTAGGTGCNSQCARNDLYLITGTTSRLGVATNVSGNQVTFANTDPLSLNLPGSSDSLDGITAASVMLRVQMVTYFVTADGTLIRRRYVNVPPVVPAVGWVDEPLVYGVENFQISYVMNDGALRDNPSAGPDGIAGNADDIQANLSLIRQVRFTVSVRSIEPSSNGQYYRETMTSTFSTRNLGYDAS